MRDGHWFDQLNHLVVTDSPRRDVVRIAGALLAGRLLGWGPTKEADAAQERCSRSLCRRSFASNKDRNFCEIKCGRCRNREKFCIIEGDPADPAKVATCCHEDQRCCQDHHECCPRDASCCPVGNLLACCPAGQECCPSDLGACCAQHETCCPARGCVDTTGDANHCGGCGSACPAGETCVDGNCRSAGGGECRDADCPVGQRCYDGACGCADGYKYCPDATRCVEERFTCCGGLPVGYCVGNMICCGSGAGAYCVHPGNPC